MELLITCGGTGGHIYPAIAVAKHFSPNNIMFIGTSDRMENQLIPKEGYTFRAISTSRNNPLKILYGFAQALAIFLQKKPQKVLSTGGWVTLPVCLAAVLLGVPIILQEQNTIPGKVNRLIGHWAKKICLGFPAAGHHFPEGKESLTGNPIRPEFETSRAQSNQSQPTQTTIKTIFVIGGSQGASIFNETLLKMFEDRQLEGVACFLITGAKHYETCINRLKALPDVDVLSESETDCLFCLDNQELHLMPYCHNISDLMKKMDLIIARAGASSLSEIAALGKPSILVPYPHAAENHQYWNAKLFADKQAAVLLDNVELSPAALKDIIKSIFSSSSRLKLMADNTRQLHNHDAAGKIAEIIKSIR